ncbi:MAG: hypothetical protein ACFCUI_03925 [Bernardetiaceae bacterium]
MQKQIIFLWALVSFLGVSLAQGQEGIRGAKVNADGALTLTISVLNSDQPYHVASVRYFNDKGELILNTNEEFRVEISKANRFATGSVRKTIPIYAGAHSIRVEVSGCANMHENEFLLSEAEAANNEVTFVFRTEVEDLVRVAFKGIQQGKPGAFTIRGVNTNIIYYADYDGVVKVLPAEARITDINVDISPTTLHNYRITGMERNEKEKNMEVILEYVGENPSPATTTAPKTDTSAPASADKKGKKKKKKK